MKDIYDCHKDLLGFIADFEKYREEDLTESDTRSKIIDKLFTEVLDWDENSIDREGYVVEGFYDYLFSIPGFQFIQDDIEYNTRTHHTNMDSYDHLQAEDLKQIATVVAAFVYNSANLDEKLPRKALPVVRN